MGLFDRLRAELEQGKDKNRPRRTGGARFMELTLRQGGSFLAANLFFCLTSAPGAALAALGIWGGQVWLVLAGGLLAGVMGGPWYVVLQDALLRAMRDEIGFWWTNCKKTLAASGTAALLPGALSGVVTAAQLAVLAAMLAGGSAAGYALLFLGLLASALIQLWFWPQLTLMKLPLAALLKNSLRLTLAYPRRALPAALLTLLYWGAVLAFLPLSLFVMPVLGAWYITLAELLFIYPTLDERFHIEEELENRKEA